MSSTHGSVHGSVTELCVASANAQLRFLKAARGLRKATRRLSSNGVVFLGQLARPSLPMLRGAIKTYEGLSEVMEGFVSTVNAISTALPAMSVALQDAQDARNAVSLSDIQDAFRTPEFQAAAIRLAQPGK